jgi:hypothetical protein
MAAAAGNVTDRNSDPRAMKFRLLLAALLLAALCLATPLAAAPADEWTELFNGRNLDGWMVKCRPGDRDKEYWKAEGGALTATVPAGSNHHYIWLLTEREFSDFELRLKVQTFEDTTGNSGIQVRSRYDDEAGWLDGPQIDIHPPGPWRSGFIYDETRGAQIWLSPITGKPSVAKEEHAPNGWHWMHAGDGNAWNDVRIICQGKKVTTIVNGVTVCDYDGTGRLDDDAHRARKVGLNGHIGLQIHPGGMMRIRFKEIRLKPIK